MILMIDNYDSFTYNIVQYCLELGADLKVIRNDELNLEQIIALNPSKIIISPGPATPNESGVCLKVIEYFAGKKPINENIFQYYIDAIKQYSNFNLL